MSVKATLNKEQVFQRLKKHEGDIRAFGVSRLGLFGSMVREEASKESDIDILVEFDEGKKNYDNFIHLAFFLEKILQKKVDLLTRNSIAEWMQPQIDKHIEYVEFDG